MEDIIILDGMEFLILDKINLSGINFLYVIATDGSNKFTLLNEYEENGKIMVKSVTDKEIIEEVFRKMNERNR